MAVDCKWLKTPSPSSKRPIQMHRGCKLIARSCSHFGRAAVSSHSFPECDSSIKFIEWQMRHNLGKYKCLTFCLHPSGSGDTDLSSWAVVMWPCASYQSNVAWLKTKDSCIYFLTHITYFMVQFLFFVQFFAQFRPVGSETIINALNSLRWDCCCRQADNKTHIWHVCHLISLYSIITVY